MTAAIALTALLATASPCFALSYEGIRENMNSTTDAALEQYAASIKGSRVIWQGWIVNVVKLGSQGDLRVDIDMDPPNSGISVPDVKIYAHDPSGSMIAALEKGSRVRFEGFVSQISKFVTACLMTLRPVRIFNLDGPGDFDFRSPEEIRAEAERARRDEERLAAEREQQAHRAGYKTYSEYLKALDLKRMQQERAEAERQRQRALTDAAAAQFDEEERDAKRPKSYEASPGNWTCPRGYVLRRGKCYGADEPAQMFEMGQ